MENAFGEKSETVMKEEFNWEAISVSTTKKLTRFPLYSLINSKTSFLLGGSNIPEISLGDRISK